MKKKKSHRLLVLGLSFLLILFLFPFGVTTAASAQGSQTSKDLKLAQQTLKDYQIDDPKVRFVTVKDLKVMGAEAKGYVNMFDDADVIYLREYSSNSFKANNRAAYYQAIVIHEYGHILQKRLVEKRAHNPYERYMELLQLNDILSKGAPKIDTDHATMTFTGLETDADCMLLARVATVYSGYIDAENGCGIRAKAMAKAVIFGEYPTDKVISKWEKVVRDDLAQAKGLSENK